MQSLTANDLDLISTLLRGVINDVPMSVAITDAVRIREAVKAQLCAAQRERNAITSGARGTYIVLASAPGLVGLASGECHMMKKLFNEWVETEWVVVDTREVLYEGTASHLAQACFKRIASTAQGA